MSVPRAHKENYPDLWELFLEIPAEGPPPAAAEACFDDIIHRHAEPHRFYHDVSHLSFLAFQFAQVRHMLTRGQSRAVLGALFLHDVIYQCQPGADETASGAYARIVLERLAIEQPVIDDARSMIIATATHLSSDFATQLFLDMDMAILAAPAEVYAHYVRGVTAEFCMKLGLDARQFAAARAARFLRPVLARDTPLFSTPPFRDLDRLARINMQNELDGAFADPGLRLPD